MPLDEVPKRPSLGSTIGKLATAMLRLDPGELARLRRMQTNGPGELAFWRLAVEFSLRTDDRGLQLVRILALLAPKGDPASRSSFHDFERRSLGAALADARYSEARLARFLELPFDKRGEALERMARLLRAKRVLPVNCLDIACLLLSDDVKHPRKLAQDYYRRFDKTAANQDEETAA